jgi:ubiquinone/menaquinone biosynthesis C-methylase UbiE
LSQIGKFTQPDHSDDPRYFIKFLDLVETFPELQEIHARSLRQMRLQPGGRGLDVGCGIGTAVRKIADIVGPEGKACGVDISEVMVAEATARAMGRSNIEFTRGEAYALPHSDASFDAVRMERVLPYVPDRVSAIKEMMRVTKPGGRVAITDVDIECTAIHSKDRALTRKMTALVADTFPHPTSGRELRSVMRAAGLQDVTMELMVLPSPYEFCIHTTTGTLHAAVEAGKVTREEMEEWYRGLAELEEAGDFLQMWFFVIAAGTVPAK